MSKVTPVALGATIPHTAGIFSDMTVDGPEIGTLVVIVDRAKNLPNRKTIGKQDPYCAARLGKEAKKTETDRRGGQTPRWDQEMRFTVHDSPDYYQLKVSVFNDDKKTEIIGETWINLAEVVVPGGGKNDLWHNLSFKGKYAGEIRIEITYYDSRPKAERAVDKKRQAAVKEVSEPSRDSMSGPRQMKPVKRRPLPNNPVTGSPGSARPAAAIPDQSQGSARGRPLPPSEPTFDHPPSHPRDLPTSDHAQDQIAHPASIRGRASDPALEHIQTPPRGRQLRQEYQTNQSPLQQVEYNTPSPRVPQPNSYRNTPYNTNGYTSSGPRAMSPAPAPLPINERYDNSPNTDFIPPNFLGRYDDPINDGDVSPRMTYQAQPDPDHYALPASDHYSRPSSPTGPPPPPPQHRVRHASPMPLPRPVTPNDHWDIPNFASNANVAVPDDPYGTSRQVTHRKSVPAYAHAKSYQAYSPPREHQRPPSRDNRPQSTDNRPGSGDHRPVSRDQRPVSRDYRPVSRDRPVSRHNSFGDRRDQPRDQYENTPRHHSYDERFRAGFESMQPTVEDAPPSPGLGALTHPSPGGFTRGYDDRRFDQVLSPAPLNLNGRGSVASGRQSVSTQSSFHMSNGYSSTGSPASFMDRTQDSSLSSKRSSTMINKQYQQPQRRESEDRIGGGMPIPHVPNSLVAGMDPYIAQEISERIYSDQRNSFSNSGTVVRHGYHPEPPQAPYQQARPTSSYGRQDRTSVFVPASTPNSYSQSIVATNGTIRERSPAPLGSMRGVPMRKSVSPSPVMRDRSRSPAPPERRLSGIPFGPDDYDALNPNVASSTPSKSGISFSGAAETKRQEDKPLEKIISHDGREIDPTDYLPVETYAAEYEKKVAVKPPLQTAASLALARPSSSGRPYSMLPASNSSVYMIKPTTTPGRTRLQKKSARPGAQQPSHPSVGPLAPISPYQDNTNAFTPRSLARTSTGDFNHPNENYAPSPSNAMTHYGSHSGGYSAGRSGYAPPIPAKVPVSPVGGGGHYQQRYQGGGGIGQGYQQHASQQQQYHQQAQQVDHGETAWSLLEEMKSIDLGAGSSRARNGRKGW